MKMLGNNQAILGGYLLKELNLAFEHTTDKWKAYQKGAGRQGGSLLGGFLFILIDVHSDMQRIKGVNLVSDPLTLSCCGK